MGFHDRMRAMVIRNLAPQPKGKGVQVTLTRKTSGAYDPVTGGTKPPTITEYEGSAVRVNYSEYAYRNTTIVYGDFQLYMSPVLIDGTDTPTPKIGDVINFLGKSVKVINLSPFNDNNIGCGWKLQVRYG